MAIEKLKGVLRPFVPPIVADALRRAGPPLRREAIRFEGSYASWEAARAASGGYDAPAILEKTLRAALAVKRGEAAYERDSVAFGAPEYRHPVLCALLLAAAKEGGRLAVLDFGGSLGSSYFQHLPYLRELASLSWRVVEQPHYVEAGNRELADGRLSFHGDLASATRQGVPAVVLVSSVLSYLESPYALLSELLALRAALVVIDRTLTTTSPTWLTVQQVPPVIYEASYPCWIFNEGELLGAFAGYRKIDDFGAHEETVVNLADGAQARYKGYTFHRS